MSTSIIGDIFLDPTTYLSFGLLDLIKPLSKSKMAVEAVETAGEMVSEASIPGSKFAKRLVTAVGKGIKVPVTAEQAVKISQDTITQGAGKLTKKAAEDARAIAGSAKVKVALSDWLGAVPTKLSVRSASNKLFHAVYSISIPIADYVRLGLKNVNNQSFSDIMKIIAENSDSEEILRGAIDAKMLPKMSEAQIKAFVKLKNSVDTTSLVQLASNAQDKVISAAVQGIEDELRVALNNQNLATDRAKEIAKKFNNIWSGMVLEEGQPTLREWASKKITDLAGSLAGEGKQFATRDEAKKALEAWLDGPELDSFWKQKYFDELTDKVKTRYGILAADNSRKIALEFSDSVRRHWLNQIGVTKLWKEADITTDSLIGMLTDILPEHFFSKTTKAGEESATQFRRALVQFRNIYKTSLNFIFSAVLSGRPGYLMTNWIDSNFRALINGVVLRGDFNNIISYFHSKGIKIPVDVYQSLSRDFLGDANAMTTKIINGEWPINDNPFTDWLRFQKYQFGETGRLDKIKLDEQLKKQAEKKIVGPQTLREKMNYKFTDWGMQAWSASTRPIRSFTNANADFNNLTEIVVRVKTYHKFYVENLHRTQAEFARRVLSAVPEEQHFLVKALLRRTGINALGFEEIVKVKDASALFSQYVPETVQKMLRDMDPVEATLVGDSVASAHEKILLDNLDKPLAEQRKLSSEFFDGVYKDFINEVENRVAALKQTLKDIDTGGRVQDVNIPESLDEIAESLEKADPFILDDELVRLQNEIEGGNLVSDERVREALKKRGIASKKGEGKKTLKGLKDGQDSKGKGEIPMDEEIPHSRAKRFRKFTYESMKQTEEEFWEFLHGANSPYSDDMVKAIEDEFKVAKDTFIELYRILRGGDTPNYDLIAQVLYAKLSAERLVGSLQRFLSKKDFAWKVHMPDGSPSPRAQKFFTWLVNAKRQKTIQFIEAINAKKMQDLIVEWDLMDFMKKLGIRPEFNPQTHMLQRITVQSFEGPKSGNLTITLENELRQFMEAVFGYPKFDFPDEIAFKHGDLGLEHLDLKDSIPFAVAPVIKDDWTGRALMQSLYKNDKTPKILEYIGAGDIKMAIKQAIMNLDITNRMLTSEITETSILNRLHASAKAMKSMWTKEIGEAKSLEGIGKIFEGRIDELFDILAHAGNQIVKEGRPGTLHHYVNKDFMRSVAVKLQALHWSSNSIRLAIGNIRQVAESRGAVLGVSGDEFILRTLAGVTNMDKDLRPLLKLDADGNIVRHSPLSERLKNVLTKPSYRSGREIYDELKRTGLGEFTIDEPNIRWLVDWLKSPEMSPQSLKQYSDEFKKLFAGSDVVDDYGNPRLMGHGTRYEYKLNEARLYPMDKWDEPGMHWGNLRQANVFAVRSLDNANFKVNDIISQYAGTGKKPIFGGGPLSPEGDAAGQFHAQIKAAYLVVKNPLVIPTDLTTWVPQAIARYLRNDIKTVDSIRLADKIIINFDNTMFKQNQYKSNLEWLQQLGRALPDALESEGYGGIKYLNLVEGAPKISDEILNRTPTMGLQELQEKYSLSSKNWSYIIFNHDQIIPYLSDMSIPTKGITLEDILRKVDEIESTMPTDNLPGKFDITNPNWDTELRMASTIKYDSVTTKLESILPDGEITRNELSVILDRFGLNIEDDAFAEVRAYYDGGFLGGKAHKSFILSTVVKREKQMLSLLPEVRATALNIMKTDPEFVALHYTKWPSEIFGPYGGGGYLMPDGVLYTLKDKKVHLEIEEAVKNKLKAEYPDLEFSQSTLTDFGGIRVGGGGSGYTDGAFFEIRSKLSQGQRETIIDYIDAAKPGQKIMFDVLNPVLGGKLQYLEFITRGDHDAAVAFIKNLNAIPEKPLFQRINGLALTTANVTHGMTNFLRDGRAFLSIFTDSANPTVFVHEMAHWILPYLTDGEWDIFMDWATMTKYTDEFKDALESSKTTGWFDPAKGEGVKKMVGDPYVSKRITAAEFKQLHYKIAVLQQEDVKGSILYREIQEAFANGWTKHIAAEAGGMSTGLRKLFDRVAQAMLDFYKKYIKGGVMDVKLTPEMRELYSRLNGMYPTYDFTPGKMKFKQGIPIANMPVYKTSATDIFGKEPQYYTTKAEEGEQVLLNFHRPYVVNNQIDRKMLLKGFDPAQPAFSKEFKKWLRAKGYDGGLVKQEDGNFLAVDYKVNEEEAAIWKAIINDPNKPLRSYGLDIYGIDMTSPEAFIAGVEQRVEMNLRTGNPRISEAWATLLNDVVSLLNGIPRVGEEIPINQAVSGAHTRLGLKEGLRTYVELLQYNLSQLERAKALLIEWKSGTMKMFDDLEAGVDTVNYLSKPDDSVWETIAKATPAISKEMRQLDEILINGGEYGGMKITGALKKTNEILLDYTTHYEWENLPRLIFPFWQFPTRSAPFWAKTLATHPEVVNFYTKYQLTSYRQRVQGGMVNSDGEPAKSLAGYVKVPGTDYWWNPTAPLSFRLLFPSAYADSVDEGYNERSMLGKVINTMNRTAKMRGISMNPYIQAMAMKAGLIDDEGQQYSIIPQLDLVPRFFQRAILSGLRKFSWDKAPELWSPSVSYKDYLIEQMILKDTVLQINQLKETAPSEEQFNTDAYVLAARVSEMLKKSPEDRRLDEMWIKYLNKYEWGETGKSWFGYMTGVYGKKYTAADAQFNELRNELNVLKRSINDAVTRDVFDLADDSLDAYDTYMERRYDSPYGDVYSSMQNVRWVTDMNGEELTGDQRVQRIADTVKEEQLQSAYYDTLSDIYQRRDDALAALPIGSPASVRKPIIEQAYKEIDELDKQYGRGLVSQYSVYNKPYEAIFNHFENKWWRALTETEPSWDAGNETYVEYKKRWNEWIEGLPELSQTIGTVFLESIREQMNSIYANQIEGGPVDIMMVKEAQARAEQGILKLMQEQGNLEGYTRHKRINDTPTDALLEAWTEMYLSKYYEMTEGKQYEAYLLAERDFKSQYPNPPTFEQLATWVMKTYPSGKFTMNELRAAYEDADEQVLSVNERQSMSRDDKGNLREQILDILEIVGPGYLSIDFNNIYASPTIGGTKEELGDIYSDWEKMTLEEVKAIYEKIKKAAIEYGVNDPSNNELITRTVAREQNDDFKLLVAAELGPRFYDDQSWFYELSYGEQAAYKKDNPLFAERLEQYKDLKAQYAEQYPVWARYYYKKAKGEGESGGGSSGTKTTSGGGGGGSGGFSDYLKNYMHQGNEVSMGYRTSLDSNKLLANVLGSRGAAGQPYWPENMVNQLRFNLEKAMWPEGMEDAMGEVMLDSLKQRFIYGKPLSESAVNFLSTLATNHPEWKDAIGQIAGM